MHGILNINKPSGITSHDVVSRTRRALKMKRVGHAGTLDPGATGVLLVCLGQATRISEYLMGKEKEYRAVLVLGEETTTEDAEGDVTASTDCSGVTPQHVERVLPSFVGEIMQVPPMVSAVHYKGKRLYELARQNRVVEREPRAVMVYSLCMTRFTDGRNPRVELDVTCGKGTYMRTLCADVGRALGCGGHMGSLVRTRVGNFGLDDAVSLEEVEKRASEGKIDEILVPMDAALQDMPLVRLEEQESALIRNGAGVPCGDRIETEVPVRIHDPDDRLVAIGRIVGKGDEAVLRPDKVFLLDKDAAD